MSWFISFWLYMAVYAVGWSVAWFTKDLWQPKPKYIGYLLIKESPIEGSPNLLLELNVEPEGLKTGDKVSMTILKSDTYA